jgi:hypothetical protein
MTTTNKLTLAVAAALALGTTASRADEAALIDALVKKGVLSTKEASHIREDIGKETGTPGANIKLSDSVSQLKIYGDLKMRYRYDNLDAQLPNSGTGSQRSRFQFRLRLDAEFSLGPDWLAGIELATNENSSAGNQTFDGGFKKYPIFISKAYLAWHNEWARVQIGKTANPFYTTDLVWDPDINPSGLFETIDFGKLLAPDETGYVKSSYSKDGKSVAPAPSTRPWDLILNAGQMYYSDNNEFNFDNDSASDAMVFETQLVASYKFSNGIKATIAPAWFVENAATLSGFVRNNSFQDNTFVSGASRDINVLLAPGDVSFKIGNLPVKAYWDFAYNVEGRKRTEDIYRLRVLQHDNDPDDFIKHHSNRDDMAYLVGVQIGQNKKAGDWSLLANWRETGIAAVDPNIHDDDFALGFSNTKGIKVAGSYNFTDFANLTVTYLWAENIRRDLTGGEATSGNMIGNANQANVLLVDFNVKF